MNEIFKNVGGTLPE